MADNLKAFNNGMGLVQAQRDDYEKNVVRRNNLVNLETTFSLLPTTTSTTSSVQNICLTISPHQIPTYRISPQIPSVCTINPNNFQVTLIPNTHPPTVAVPFKEGKHDQMATHLYSRSEKDMQSIYHEDLKKEIYNLRKTFDEELSSRNYQSLKYENLCVHPNVELPPGYTIPKFNTFNGKGNPVAHLKDYCSRLIGIGHNEALRMRLFIQSLSGLALTWYTKQDFGKWHTWEDMARDFVKQYEFNNEDDLHITDFLRVKKMPHESFQDYAIRWRLEASKIHPPLSERELISTFIHIQEGLYYEKLLGACTRNFSDLIRIGKELENGIQGGRIMDNLTFMAMCQPQHHQNHQLSQPQPLQNLAMRLLTN